MVVKMGSKIQLKQQEEEQAQENVYREDFRQRKGMEPRRKKLMYLVIAAAALYIVYLIVPLLSDRAAPACGFSLL